MKNNISTIKSWLLLCSVLIMLFNPGCKCCNDCKDPKCKNYDPCCEVTKPNADFIVRSQSYPPFDEYSQPEPCDTILNGDFEFIAQYYGSGDYNDTPEYHWKIWNSSYDYTKRKFQLDFSDYFKLHPEDYDKPFPVTLMVIPKAKSACFPGLKDTLKMTRYLVNPSYDLFRNFEYEGYFSSQPNVKQPLVFLKRDLYTPGIKLTRFNLPGVKDTIKIINWSNAENMRSNFKEEWWTNRAWLGAQGNWMEFNDGMVEYRAKADFSSDGHHKIHIDYWYTMDKINISHYTFDGIAK